MNDTKISMNDTKNTINDTKNEVNEQPKMAIRSLFYE